MDVERRRSATSRSRRRRKKKIALKTKARKYTSHRANNFFTTRRDPRCLQRDARGRRRRDGPAPGGVFVASAARVAGRPAGPPDVVHESAEGTATREIADTANHRISAEGRTRLVPLVPVVSSRRRVTARVSIPHLTLHTHHLPRAFRLRADLHRGHAEGGGGEGRARGKSQGGVPLRRVSRRSRRREPAPERRAVGSADASRGNARRPGERERTTANASEHETVERRGAGTRDGGRRGAPPAAPLFSFVILKPLRRSGCPLSFFCFVSLFHPKPPIRPFLASDASHALTVFHHSFVT